MGARGRHRPHRRRHMGGRRSPGGYPKLEAPRPFRRRRCPLGGPGRPRPAHLGDPGGGADRVRHRPGRWSAAGDHHSHVPDDGTCHLPSGHRITDPAHNRHRTPAAGLGGVRSPAQGHRRRPHILLSHTGEHCGWPQVHRRGFAEPDAGIGREPVADVPQGPGAPWVCHTCFRESR